MTSNPNIHLTDDNHVRLIGMVIPSYRIRDSLPRMHPTLVTEEEWRAAYGVGFLNYQTRIVQRLIEKRKERTDDSEQRNVGTAAVGES